MKNNEEKEKFLIIVATHDNNRAISAIEYHSKNSRNFVIVYSNDNPDAKVLDCIEKNKVKYIVRDNIGRDYGAYYDCINENCKLYDWFMMINDDINFIDINWIETMIKYWEMDDADILSIQTSCNNHGQLIPRGSLWSIKTNVFDKTIWKKPNNNEDAYDQEMNLIPELMKKHKFKMKQIGNGFDIMYPDGYGPLQTQISLLGGEIYG